MTTVTIICWDDVERLMMMVLMMLMMMAMMMMVMVMVIGMMMMMMMVMVMVMKRKRKMKRTRTMAILVTTVKYESNCRWPLTRHCYDNTIMYRDCMLLCSALTFSSCCPHVSIPGGQPCAYPVSHFRQYISDVLNCSWCVEQPCFAKCVDEGINNCFLIHVDDLHFAGSYNFWTSKCLPAVTSKFNVNYTELKGDGSSVSFLKRQIVKLVMVCCWCQVQLPTR